MSDPAIEKGVPVPIQIRQNGSLVAIVKQMAIGDSVVMESRNRALSLILAMKRLAMKGTTRSVDGGVRVWRVE